MCQEDPQTAIVTGFTLVFDVMFRNLCHSMVGDELRERLVIFGGTDGQRTFGDLFMFDLRSSEWFVCEALLVASGRVSAREGHTASIDGRRMVVRGGVAASKPVSDSFSLELGANELCTMRLMIERVICS